MHNDAKKTEKMKQYEEETGKHAIWKGEITKEFKRWKKGEKMYSRDGDRWTIYLKDKNLDVKFKNFLSEMKSKAIHYSQSQLAIDAINILIEISERLKKIGVEYKYESILDYMKRAVDFYSDETRKSKSEIYEDFIQSLSPLIILIKLMKENLNDSKELIKIIDDSEKTINDLERKIDLYFKEPTIQRFLTKYDVLHVEDEELTRNAIKYYFEKKNFTIKSVGKAEDVLYELKKTTPRLILIDIGLPGKIKGDALCKMIKKREEYKKIPIILFTAKILEKDKEKVISETGANDIIFKSQLKNLDDLEILLKYLK